MIKKIISSKKNILRPSLQITSVTHSATVEISRKYILNNVIYYKHTIPSYKITVLIKLRSELTIFIRDCSRLPTPDDVTAIL